MTPEQIARLRNTARPYQGPVELYLEGPIALVGEKFALKFELLGGTKPRVKIVAPNSLRITEGWHMARDKFPPPPQGPDDYIGSKRVFFDHTDSRRHTYLGVDFLLTHGLYLPDNNRDTAKGIGLVLFSSQPTEITYFDLLKELHPEPRLVRICAMAA